MKTKHVESLEDMVFRNKNKLYGAYSLRRKYPRYLTLSLVVSLFLLITGMAYPVISGYRLRHAGNDDSKSGIDVILLPPPAPELPVVPPPPPPPVSVTTSARFILPKVVDDSVESDFGKQMEMENAKPLMPTDDIAEIDPAENPPEKVIEQVIKQEPVTSVGEMPKFPGGDEALFAFLRKNLKYPEEDKMTGISGIVYVTFVVETDGSITEAAVVRGISTTCDEEALRVIRAMPNWTPGKQNNLPVRVRYNIPIKYTLH